jgi:hypothetical protein
VALEGGGGLGRDGCGGDSGDDDGKSENVDSEFHDLVTPLWILIDRKAGFLYTETIGENCAQVKYFLIVTQLVTD